MNDTAADSKVRGALARYRVLAIVTGTFLLLVTAGVILKYVAGVENPTIDSVTSWIAIVHGWIFIVYLVTCVHVWILKKWGLGRLVTMALGGIVPFLSFVVERRIAREVAAEPTP